MLERALEFRGKVPKDYQSNFFKEGFVYGSLILCEDDTESTIINNEYEAQVLTDSVGQFTGSFDVDGNKIFEGDIVECKGERCQVVWLEKRCGFYLLFNGFSRDIVNRSPYQSVYKMNAFKKKIIGDIHNGQTL